MVKVRACILYEELFLGVCLRWLLTLTSHECHGLFRVATKKTCPLTHWGRVTHICIGKLTIIDSDNGLSPGQRQAIIWTNAGILLIRPLGTNFSEILIGIQTFSFKKMYFKMSSAKWRRFCFGLNVLMALYEQNPPVTLTKASCVESVSMLWHHVSARLYQPTGQDFILILTEET